VSKVWFLGVFFVSSDKAFRAGKTQGLASCGNCGNMLRARTSEYQRWCQLLYVQRSL